MITLSQSRPERHWSRLALAGVALAAWTACGHAAEATTTALGAGTVSANVGTAGPSVPSLTVTTIAPPSGFFDAPPAKTASAISSGSPLASETATASSPQPTTAPAAPATPESALEVVRVGDNKLTCEQLAAEINGLNKLVATARQGDGDVALASTVGGGAPSGQPQTTGDMLVDAGAAAATTVLAGTLPVIGPVAGAVVDRTITSIRNGNRNDHDNTGASDAKQISESRKQAAETAANARKANLTTAYTAAQRQQHLMQIFNGKGC